MVVILVDLPLTVVDNRVELAVAVLCVLVAGREGLDVCEGFLVGEPTLQRMRPLRARSGMMRCRTL